jgi:hypothetical protein
MPGDVEDRMFFSYDVGPIHFISISTEYYYFLDQGPQPQKSQYRRA